VRGPRLRYLEAVRRASTKRSPTTLGPGGQTRTATGLVRAIRPEACKHGATHAARPHSHRSEAQPPSPQVPRQPHPGGMLCSMNRDADSPSQGTLHFTVDSKIVILKRRTPMAPPGVASYPLVCEVAPALERQPPRRSSAQLDSQLPFDLPG
jgi:hypothetical protein